MNSATRLAIIAEMHQRELDIIRTKGREYTLGAEEGNDGDTLANLKNVAARTGTTPMQVWAVYFLKHADAISSYVMDPTRPLSEPISGRIDDARTYLGMLECLVREEEAEELPATQDHPDAEPAPLAGDMPADRIRAGVGLPPEPPEKVVVIDRPPNVADVVRVRAGHGTREIPAGSIHRVKSAGTFWRNDEHLLLQLEGVDGYFAATRFEVVSVG